MAKREKNYIVPESEIFTMEQVRATQVRYRSLHFPTPEDCLVWVAKMQLIRNSMRCIPCDMLMSLHRSLGAKDGFRWHCNECLKCQSVRHMSFFSHSSLPLYKLIAMIYGWSMDYTQTNIMYECEVHSPTTLVEWSSFCRDICEQYLIDNPMAIGGLNEDGTSKVVEIGESTFVNQKQNRGAGQEGHWVFGGVERDSGNCFLVEVPDRRSNTLIAMMKKYILPGTIIMISEGWKADTNLSKIDGGIYEPCVFVHQGNFVDPNHKDVHTQNVKNLWMRAKGKLRRQFGTSEAMYTSYMHEFIWRNRFKGSNMFAEFVICLRGQYCLGEDR